MIRYIPEKSETLADKNAGNPVFHSYLVPLGEKKNLKFIVFDARTMKNGTQNYGWEQIQWFEKELKAAEEADGKNGGFEVVGVVLVHSWPW